MLTKESHYNIRKFAFTFNNKELTTKHLVINSTHEPESVFFTIDAEIISKGQNKPLEYLPHKFYSQLNPIINDYEVQNETQIKNETKNNKQYFYYNLWESNEPLPLFLISNYVKVELVIISKGEFNISHWFCDDNFLHIYTIALAITARTITIMMMSDNGSNTLVL